LDGDHTLSKNLSNFSHTVFAVRHGEVESIIPDFFKLIRVVEMSLCDFEIPINGFAVVARFLEYFSGVEDFLSTLVTHLGTTTGVVFVDLLNEMGSVFVCDTESLTIHASFLIHVDSLLGLLCIDVALFRFTVVTAFKVELGLVHEHLCY
jgi:hypothetical protein